MQINPTPEGYDLMVPKPIAGTDVKMLALHSRHKTLEAAIAVRDELAADKPGITKALTDAG